MPTNKSRIRGQKGQALMETVIIFPFLALFLVIVVWTGSLLVHKTRLTMAAREAAVQYARGASVPQIEYWLRQNVCGGAMGMNPGNLSVSVTSTLGPDLSEVMDILGILGMDLTGYRVEVSYREGLPFLLNSVAGNLIIFKEDCVIMKQ